MKVVCTWFEEQGKPAVLREEEPLDNATIYGLCDAHAVQLTNEVQQTLLKRSLVPLETLRA
jgi:hypothetical protein